VSRARIPAAFALGLLATLPLAAAAKGPWSEIDGSFANPAHADEVDVLIRNVDSHAYNPPRDKLKVTPGPHWVTLVSTRVADTGVRPGQDGTSPLNTRQTQDCNPLGRAADCTQGSRHSTRATVAPWVFKAEPCMRYLLAGQHEGMSTKFVVEVVGVEPISGCGGKVDVEAPEPAPPASAEPATTSPDAPAGPDTPVAPSAAVDTDATH
jgi:hypothetical protein